MTPRCYKIGYIYNGFIKQILTYRKHCDNNQIICYFYLLFPGAAIATHVTMDCPLQNWNIYDHAQYYCTVNNTFIRFRVVELNESDKSMIFSTTYNTGRTLTSGKFSSTLLTKANGLTAVITFPAAINNSQVICDDYNTAKICNVTIKGNLIIAYSIR